MDETELSAVSIDSAHFCENADEAEAVGALESSTDTGQGFACRGPCSEWSCTATITFYAGAGTVECQSCGSLTACSRCHDCGAFLLFPAGAASVGCSLCGKICTFEESIGCPEDVYPPARNPSDPEAHAYTAEAQTDPFFGNDRFFEAFLRAILLPPGPLDRRLKRMSVAVADADFSSVFFTSTPIAAALAKKPFQILLLVIVLATFLLLTMRIFEDGGVSGRHFRFTALELRNGATNISHPGIARLGLIRTCTRCPQEHISVQGPSMTIRYEEEVDGPGWWFTTASGDPALDPVRFLLSASADGQTWTEVGASGWQYQTDGRLDLHTGKKWPTSSERGWDERVVISVPEHWRLLSVGTYAVAAPMFLALWVAAFSRHELLAKWILVLGLSVISSLTLASAIMVDDPRERAILWLSFSGPFALCVLIGWWERYLVVGLLGVGMAFVCTGIGQYLGEVDGAFGLVFWVLTGSVLIVFCTVLLYQRRKVITASYEALAPDRASYDEIWEETLSSAEARTHVERLQRVCCALSVALDDREARQKHPPPRLHDAKSHTHHHLSQHLDALWSEYAGEHSSGPRRSRRRLTAGSMRLFSEADVDASTHSPIFPPTTSATLVTLQERTPSAGASPVIRRHDFVDSSEFSRPRSVSAFSHTPSGLVAISAARSELLPRLTTSLDQLFAQAAGLRPIFLRKVASWAAVSRGLFRFKAPFAKIQSITHAAPPELQPVFFPLWEDGESSLHSHRGMAASDLMRGFVRWEAVGGCEERRAGVRWGKLKGTERAIEKVLRSYGGDVSRLLDACRETIVFEKVEDLVDCMQAILLDGEVRLARCRNRLDPACDAKKSGGFRNVCINLTVCSNEAKLLGLEQHICELQLLLLSYARMAKNDGHKRYVKFRNARAE